MAIKTAEEFVDKIDGQLIWRRKELTDLKFLIEEKASQTRRRVVCRAGVALLYAHWEGFVKQVGTDYLKFVANQRLKNKELSLNFLVLSMKSKIDKANGCGKYSLFSELLNSTVSDMDRRANIAHKGVIETRSNLTSTVFAEIAWLLGIDYEEYSTKEKMIDLNLVNKRNYVAHGEFLVVEVKEFMDLYDMVIELMNLFRNQIQNAVVEKTYLQQQLAVSVT